MKSNYSDLQLEKFILGELDEKQVSAITNELDRDYNLKGRLEAIKKSNKDFSHAFNIRQDVVKIEKIASSCDESIVNKLKKYFLNSQLRYVGATATIMLFFVFATPQLIPQFSNDGVRLKGITPHLIIYKKSKEKSERLLDDSAVREGEILQVSYVSAKSKYGMIFSVDGNGVFTLHYPEAPLKFAKLIDKGQVVLPDAFELDDSPRFETFFFLTSDKALEINPIIEKLKALKLDQFSQAPLRIESDDVLNQFSLTLKKLK